MKRIIVYGLGNIYKKYAGIIDSKYEVVGLCDKNPEVVKEKGVLLEDLSSIQNTIDYILVANAYGPNVYPDLIRLGIDKEKIKFLCHEDYFNNQWNTTPILGYSYSGSGEDIIVAFLLKEKWNIECDNVCYIELGVNDPIFASNTFYFYKKGGNGILVEANPNYIDVIKEIRNRDIVINKAIFKESDVDIPFYLSDNAGLSSIKNDHLLMSESWIDYSIEKEIKVKTISINDVFSYLTVGCDLLSIDLEGYDLEALMALDMTKYRPKVIIAELNWTNLKERDYYNMLFEFIISNNYECYYYNEYNGIFYDSRATT